MSGEEFPCAIKEVEPLLESEPDTLDFVHGNAPVDAVQAYERVPYPIAPQSRETAAKYERKKRSGLVPA